MQYIQSDERAIKLSKEYGINVLGINDSELVYELNGYIHLIPVTNVSRAKLDNPATMIQNSYLEYINNTKLSNSSLKALTVIGDDVIVVNTNTNSIIRIKKGNIRKDSIEMMTQKPAKLRNAIIKSLGYKYSYDKCFPTKYDELTTITCPVHGDFTARVANLIYNNSGCPHCANEYKGFSRTKFVEACIRNNQAGNGLLYLIKITKGEESFLKVGITSHPDLKYRCSELKAIGCEIKEIMVKVGWAQNVYNLEKYVHRNMQHSKYLPSFEFNGRQECYTLDSEEYIKELINERWKDCC